jgi:hypothetical protein
MAGGFDVSRDGVPIGDATFWFVGRGDRQSPTATGHSSSTGLVDESSKLNLNAPVVAGDLISKCCRA